MNNFVSIKRLLYIMPYIMVGHFVWSYCDTVIYCADWQSPNYLEVVTTLVGYSVEFLSEVTLL
jgi:hypothetical protein